MTVVSSLFRMCGGEFLQQTCEEQEVMQENLCVECGKQRMIVRVVFCEG